MQRAMLVLVLTAVLLSPAPAAQPLPCDVTDDWYCAFWCWGCPRIDPGNYLLDWEARRNVCPDCRWWEDWPAREPRLH